MGCWNRRDLPEPKRAISSFLTHEALPSGCLQAGEASPDDEAAARIPLSKPIGHEPRAYAPRRPPAGGANQRHDEAFEAGDPICWYEARSHPRRLRLRHGRACCLVRGSINQALDADAFVRAVPGKCAWPSNSECACPYRWRDQQQIALKDPKGRPRRKARMVSIC